MRYGESTRKEASRRYYENHREEILRKKKMRDEINRERKNEAKRNKRKELQAIVTEAKSMPCADCKIEYPYYVMDLDHVRGEKVACLSKLVRSGGSVEAVLEEIAKCEAVCSNCHRERSFTRGQCGAQL